MIDERKKTEKMEIQTTNSTQQPAKSGPLTEEKYAISLDELKRLSGGRLGVEWLEAVNYLEMYVGRMMSHEEIVATVQRERLRDRFGVYRYVLTHDFTR